jgi:hypothetical protein
MLASSWNPGACRLRLRTAVVTTCDEWSVARFELLASFKLKSSGGNFLFAVAAREREPLEACDPVLVTVHPGHFDEMWLSAVGEGAAKRPEECEATSDTHGVPIDWPRRIDLKAACEASPGKGRFIADCSLSLIHRFQLESTDGRPNGVQQPAGAPMLLEGADLVSVYVHVRNVAIWLALLESDERESPARELRS